MSRERWWIVETRCRCVVTQLVRWSSKKEAQLNLQAGKAEDCCTDYYGAGKPRIVREDKPRKER